MSKKFGIIGTITYDVITFESGQSFEGVGGVLYQAAVLCGLREDTFIYTNLGHELLIKVEEIIKKWPTLRRGGIRRVQGPGNRVCLHYPEKGERAEILSSVVPPLDPTRIIEDLPHLDMLVLVINSGFDIELGEWRKIVRSASCPVWLDIHSLPLEPKLNCPRKYLALPQWEEWVEGVSFLQANKKEVASILSHPEKEPSEPEISLVGKRAFELGAKSVFVTLGREGILVMTPEISKRMNYTMVKSIVDTTGCGDVFCAGTVKRLAEGENPCQAGFFGLQLAAKAAKVKGIEETYAMASQEFDSSARYY